ncbi:hypothetical protein HZF05_21415 [Sphingomonas sp. CGMCC 1.13654]|uniref:Uncharacterized protein n=1 Tax=Sphingomonas chungangi TaxID=2683589 RepID=A0A838LCA6_9SPHN|nr:hypothetical protein [Sphingomonas chungangi]MBA2936647.1 hypothetical protein [Sphingomonas chungangi]MVW56032.1 hypothetical protein [Sphingomonas chungangi]
MAKVNKWVAGLVLAAMGAAAPAQAGCWTARETGAAQVRDMQTMLMVAALRCRAAHIDISADYDGFVIAQKDAIAAANFVIKQHFAAAGGNQTDYDRFATSLANVFGDDATTEATCAEAAALAHEGSAAAPAQLEQVAESRVFPASLPGGACAAPATPVVMAAAMPAKEEALPPVVALAAPPPVQQPVTLPADVVAALTVLAHYKAAEAAPAAASVTQTALATSTH